MVLCSETEYVKNNYLNVTSYFAASPDYYWCPPDNTTRKFYGQHGDTAFGYYQLMVNGLCSCMVDPFSPSC